MNHIKVQFKKRIPLINSMCIYIYPVELSKSTNIKLEYFSLKPSIFRHFIIIIIILDKKLEILLKLIKEKYEKEEYNWAH